MRRSERRVGSEPAAMHGQSWIGISGYDYLPWRGAFYPDELPRREWLAFASRVFDSIELNGTFYSLKTPVVYRRWASAVPQHGFCFAIKGSRFITHNLKLRNATVALANFLASGVLELGAAMGPFLWQLPRGFGFNAERVREFLELLPRTTLDAARLARKHDHRVLVPALTPRADLPLRHAFEVRHPSWFDEPFFALLREFGAGFVIADTAGRFPYAEEVTADFVYVRLHGAEELYASGYTEQELRGWAFRVARWRAQGLDVHVYFDNDAKVHAPHDAIGLEAFLESPG